jgi:hypothetical protein
MQYVKDTAVTDTTLVPMQFTDTKAAPGRAHTYRVIAVNTVGLQSKPSADSVAADGIH